MTPSGVPPPITVIGIGPSPLGERAESRLRAATLVIGSRRHLAATSRAVPARRSATVELGGDLDPALAALATAEGPSVVLASGDPGFFGGAAVG
jgi:precorrin-6Y C5,15-methyltransferase (decarboxylating)